MHIFADLPRMLIRISAGLLLLFSIVWLLGPDPAAAQRAQRPFGKVVKEWNQTLDLIGQEVGGVELSALRAETLKERLTAIAAEAQKFKTRAEAEITSIERQLEALGPPPAEDEPAETIEIAAQRLKIREDIAFYQDRIKQANLVIVRGGQLANQIGARTLVLSIEQLAFRYPFPLAPDTVVQAVPDFLRILTLLGRSPLDWWGSLSDVQKEQIVFYRFAVVVVLAVVFGWGLRRALLHWFGRDPAAETPTYTLRLTRAVTDGTAHGLVPALILGGLLAHALSDKALISGLFAQVYVNLCAVAIMIVLAWSLPRAVLAPELPAWRLIPVSQQNARRVSRRITVLAAVFGGDIFLVVSSRDLVPSHELIALYTLLASTLEVGCILALVHGNLWAHEGAVEQAESGAVVSKLRGRWGFWTTLRRVVVLVALAVAAAALAGYSNASIYLIDKLVISGMIVGVLVLLRGLFREVIGVAIRSRRVQASLAISHKTRNLSKFWLRGLLDLVIYVVGMVMILVVWGVAARDISSWARTIWRGVTIGDNTFALRDILLAIAVFIVALTVTRMIQRLLNERIFPQTDLDVGVRNSFSIGLGYVGFAIALALAVTAIGLDLSNIAIIAGALSVGIGFGLQNVVNNFVSGLILLIERPIKVGDWIKVGEHEGYVRRINVRATEIETFRRAAVIVPNSDLISGAVTNWTHKERFGRVELQVGVAYGSDVAQVMDVLRQCLVAHEAILPTPEPYVLFRGFGDSALDFEARGNIANVGYRLSVQSDLRVAIYLAFEEAGIEIPFPQRDLHIKSVERLDDAFHFRTERPEATARSTGTTKIRTGPSKGEE